jgi:hypothetical protein
MESQMPIKLRLFGLLVLAISFAACGQEEKICTLLGCDDFLYIELSGLGSPDYIIEAGETQEPTLIVHCFLQTSDENLHPYSSTIYALDDPALQEIAQVSPALSMCRQADPGHAKVQRRSDGSVHEIQVLCLGEPPPGLGWRSFCNGTSVLLDYTPEEVTLTVHWNGQSKTQTVSPSYYSFRPNGPDCPPECRSAFVEITLP